MKRSVASHVHLEQLVEGFHIDDGLFDALALREEEERAIGSAYGCILMISRRHTFWLAEAAAMAVYKATLLCPSGK